jgi:hypothetical protein
MDAMLFASGTAKNDKKTESCCLKVIPTTNDIL